MDSRAQAWATEAEELAISGLFDAAWYAQRYPDVDATAPAQVLHYLRHGWREHRWPNPYFDSGWYFAGNADVVAAGINPLLHYLRHGDLEGRKPSPHFDPGWYRLAHGLAADRLALRHFLPRRSTGLFAPCAALYAVPFLPEHRPAAVGDPYRHYLDAMAQAQREPFPDPAVVAACGLFDANYYLINGADVRAAALDPVTHFCRYGWIEKRKPNLYFDTAWYLATNPRVARLGLNPLVHYVCEGEAAGRRPVPYFDPAWYRASYDVPPAHCALAHYLAHRRGQAVSPTPWFDIAWYVARHGEELGRHRDPFAHFLQAGMRGDVDPSPSFDAAEYRRQHMPASGRGGADLPSAATDNPLIHFLLGQYAQMPGEA